MKHTLFSLTIASFCAIAPMAFAQDTATTDTPKTQATDQATTGSETFPVADETAGPKPGELYLREEHGPWEVRCAKNKAEDTSKEACHLYHELADDDGKSVAIIELQRLKDGGKAAAGVIFTSPLGTVLTSGVVFRIDSGKAQPYPYLFCDEVGCTARFGLTPGQVASMRKGANGKITIAAISAPDKPINLTMSLSGFTAAWNAIAR